MGSASIKKLFGLWEGSCTHCVYGLMPFLLFTFLLVQKSNKKGPQRRIIQHLRWMSRDVAVYYCY